MFIVSQSKKLNVAKRFDNLGNSVGSDFSIVIENIRVY